MSLIIPFRDLPAFRETVVLDGETFILDFQYNTRAEFWTMSLFSRDAAPLLTGVKVVLSYELIQRYGTRSLPAGQVVAIDITDILERIKRDDLPESVELVYVTEDEFSAV